MLFKFFILAFVYLISQIDSHQDLLPEVTEGHKHKLGTLKQVGVFKLVNGKDPHSVCRKLGFHYVMMSPPITELEAPVFFDSPIHDSMMEITDGGYAVLKNNPKFIYCQPRAERMKYLDPKQSLSKRFEALNKAVRKGLNELESIQTYMATLKKKELREYEKDTFAKIQKEWDLLFSAFPYEHQHEYLDKINTEYVSQAKKANLQSLLSNEMLPFSFQVSILTTDYPEVVNEDDQLVDLLDQWKLTSQEILDKIKLTLFYVNEYDSVLKSQAYKIRFHNPHVKAPPKLLVTTVLKIKKAAVGKQRAN